jgi:N6-L-threonylcarbamoyladenine synthase
LLYPVEAEYRQSMDLDSTLPDMQDAPLTVLGLESSCDETAAAIVRLDAAGQASVLAEAIRSQNAAHAPYGGVVPEIAARAHAEIMDELVAQVLIEADLALADIDGIAATSGPGLIGGVMAALMTAKGLALGAEKPLIAVNHLEGHALSPRLSESVAFPYLLLLVSGGHTQLLIAEEIGRYRRLGSTLDDAAGEAFDKTAKIMGLGFPGGPALEQIAKTGNPERFELPTPLNHRDGCDFSFAGLKTAARQVWDNLGMPTDADKADLAAAMQQKIAYSLAIRSRNAMKYFNKTYPDMEASSFVVAGGVAANRAVRQALENAAEADGFQIVIPPMKWCTDNAAMIALVGAEHLRRGKVDDLTAPARARWPLDAVSARLDPAVGSGRKGPKA